MGSEIIEEGIASALSVRWKTPRGESGVGAAGIKFGGIMEITALELKGARRCLDIVEAHNAHALEETGHPGECAYWIAKEIKAAFGIVEEE